MALTDELLVLLREHPLVRSVRVVNYDETPAGKLELKLRCRLTGNYQLQVWLHHEPEFEDYAYQLFAERPILRWDNAPHYPQIPTAPHHFHNQFGRVSESSLSGEPLEDLRKALSEIARWLAQPTANDPTE